MLLFVTKRCEKRITESQDGRNLAAHAPFVICTRVTTLHS